MSSYSIHTMSDDALISSLANGESKTIEYIYKTCYPVVEKMIFKMDGSTQDAYDVFQDGLTVLYEKAKHNNLDIGCKASTYLIAITKNIWLTRLAERKKRSFTVLHEHHEGEVYVKDDIDTFFEMEKNVAQLNTSFQKIGEPCNELLKAFYVHNKSMQEITSQFGYTNTDNAKTQKYKCLTRLRKLFFREADKIEENEPSRK